MGFGNGFELPFFDPSMPRRGGDMMGFQGSFLNEEDVHLGIVSFSENVVAMAVPAGDVDRPKTK